MRIGQRRDSAFSLRMLKPTSLFFTGLFLAGTAFAAPLPSSPSANQDSTVPAAEQKKPLPLDPKNMDTSVKPGDGFYLYANGNWVKNNPVPPEYSRWAAFIELDEKNKAALHEIAEKAAAIGSKDAKKSGIEKASAAD